MLEKSGCCKYTVGNVMNLINSPAAADTCSNPKPSLDTFWLYLSLEIFILGLGYLLQILPKTLYFISAYWTHHLSQMCRLQKLWLPLWERAWMQRWTWSTARLDSPWPLGWPCWVWREERKGFGGPLATYLQLQVLCTYTVIQVDIYVATIKYLTMRIFQWGWHILCLGPWNLFESKCN